MQGRGRLPHAGRQAGMQAAFDPRLPSHVITNLPIKYARSAMDVVQKLVVKLLRAVFIQVSSLRCFVGRTSMPPKNYIVMPCRMLDRGTLTGSCGCPDSSLLDTVLGSPSLTPSQRCQDRGL